MEIWGRLTKDDLLILISYSGNTEELKNIIKYAKNIKIILVGIVSNKNSDLYKSANIKILFQKLKSLAMELFQLQVQLHNYQLVMH
jgi:arabinose-5-phosphate isomerase